MSNRSLPRYANGKTANCKYCLPIDPRASYVMQELCGCGSLVRRLPIGQIHAVWRVQGECIYTILVSIYWLIVRGSCSLFLREYLQGSWIKFCENCRVSAKFDLCYSKNSIRVRHMSVQTKSFLRFHWFRDPSFVNRLNLPPLMRI